ncbi:hypothetical protein BN961_03792 [Afipia felis]|uniref:Uncharacterized protein n=1 Tax=Afipia felis TaxID=1035 RepID=A0A090N8Q7_AFIFE|nr:hypothetical protein BN961_03792 [Afipia felis]
MIGDAALRKIIGADTLGAVAGADLTAPVGRTFGGSALAFTVEHARAQDIHRGGAVFVLRAAVLHHDDDAGRDVGDANRGFGLVDMLAARTLRAHCLDTQIAVLDVDVDVLGFRQHGHRGGRGVDAAGGFGIRHALDAMHAGFEFQFGKRAAALHFGDDFLVAAHGAFAGGHHFDLPALKCGETLVHAEQVAREQ